MWLAASAPAVIEPVQTLLGAGCDLKDGAGLALLEGFGNRVQWHSSTEGEAGTPGPVAAVSQMTAAEARPRRGI